VLHILSATRIYADLAIAIFEKCADATIQIECLDETPGCNYIGDTRELAFTTAPVPMEAGKTYFVYIGASCNKVSATCDPLNADETKPSTLTVAQVACA